MTIAIWRTTTPLLAIIAIVAAEPSPVSAQGQPTPVAVLEILFEVARTSRFERLAGLCDPEGEGDGDTRRICALARESRGRDEFARAFARGRVVGPVRRRGTRAEVPFVFGPRGADDETMRLVQRRGRWYLLSF